MNIRAKLTGFLLTFSLLWNTIPLGVIGAQSEALSDTDGYYHDHTNHEIGESFVSEIPPLLMATTGPFSGGSGTVSDPYLVATPQDVQKLSSYTFSHFRQICDISMEGYSVSPISTFYGSYDGGGFAIRGLSMTSYKERTGLIGNNYGTIKNLRLKNCNIYAYAATTNLFCGAIAARNYGSGKIINCSVSGNVEGETGKYDGELYVGGLIGLNQGLMENCRNSAAVTGNGAGCAADVYAGGITGNGNTDSTIKNCFNEGKIQAIDGRNCLAGGITAINYGEISGVKNTGDVYANSTVASDTHREDAYAGGIVAYNRSVVNYGENTAKIHAESTCGHTEAGGVAGYIGGEYGSTTVGEVNYSKNSGEVTANSSGGQSNAGGIAATCYYQSFIRYSCNTGKISATDSKLYNLATAGGLVGTLMYATMMQSCNHGDVLVNSTQYTAIAAGFGYTTEAVIMDCYNAGNIHTDYYPSPSYRYGHVAGLFYDSDTTCQNCYNVGKVTAKYSSNHVYGLYGVNGGTDRNSVFNCYTTNLYRNNRYDALMSVEKSKQQATYVGYDFEKTWAIDPAVNNGQPYLRNVPDEDDPHWYIDPAEIVPVTGVTLSPTTLNLVVGGMATLTARVLPDNALDQSVTWSSDTPRIAQVSQDGKVTAKSAGSTYIRVQTNDGAYSASCRVTVTTYYPTFSGGAGTSSNPYLIATPQDLMNMIYAPSAHYRQVANISMEGYDFIPIGDKDVPFSGSYNGNGYLITDLTMDRSDRPYIGLFGYNLGSITNVNMARVTVIGYSDIEDIYCGGVVAYNKGTLANCTVAGNLSGTTRWQEQDVYVGGVCGYSSLLLTNCAFNGTVNSKVSYLDCYAYSGGIAGYGAACTNCQNYGRITASAAVSSDAYAGGIMGYSTGQIKSSFNAGEIHAENSRRSFAGGIVGCNMAAVTSTKNIGRVYASTAFNDSNEALYALAGGISGSSFATISYGENEGTITAASTSSHAYAGGVVGYNNANCILQNSKNSGTVTAGSTGGESRAGGIASSTYRDSIVRYCCNTGEVSITDNPYYWSGCAGGVIAVLQYGTVKECCNHGDVTIDSKAYEPEGGAIVGSATDAILQDCYSDANVHSNFQRRESYNNGILEGIGGGNGTQFINCYFSGTLTSKYSYTEKWGVVKQWGGSEHTITNCYVINLYSSTETSARMTDAQSRQQSTYAGFNFSSVWAIAPNINNGRPYLRNVPSDTASGWYSGPEDKVHVSGVTLNTNELQLHIGDQKQLVATVLPDDATYKTVFWSVDDSTVVKVDENGKLTAVGGGMATVTVTTKEGGFTASCLVIVSDHEYETEVVPPDCWSDGYTIYSCIYCDEQYLDDWVYTDGHQMGAWEIIVPPGCYDWGTQQRTCINCDYTEITDVEPLWHNMVYYEGKAPTCTEYGWDEYYICSLCGESSYWELPPTGHTMGVWYETTAPTCLTKGAERRDCTDCDHYETREVSALGHNLTKHSAKAPTCTEIGWNAYETCSRCDYSTYAELPANGHSYKATVTSPTCTEQGYTTNTCTACGDSYADSYVDATGHTMGEWYETIAPGEETPGEERRDCVDCQHYETGEIPATGPLYLRGDVNGDGKVDWDDIYALRLYLAGVDVVVVPEAIDPNADGVVNMRDVARLAQYLSGVKVELH